jgi:hypothetical protein
MVSLPVARRLSHLAAVVAGLDSQTDAGRWFITPHPRLVMGQRPAELLRGEWEAIHPGPAMVLAAAAHRMEAEDF